MTDKTDSKEREAPDDDQLVTIYKQANGEDVGKAQPLTTKRIINAMRAAFQAGRASLSANAGEPMFWVRLCGDGLYEGPIHNARIEEVRKQSGVWSPLYLAAPPTSSADSRKGE